jgi:hypothetical protein
VCMDGTGPRYLIEAGGDLIRDCAASRCPLVI